MTTRRPLSTGARRAALAVALVVLVVVALPGSPASSADVSGHAVRVWDGRNHIVAVFRSAKCAVTKLGFISSAYDNGYRLAADVVPFDGFHDYRLQRGHYTPQVIVLDGPSGVQYASDFKPPYPVHGGGAINFTDKGALMGVGFSPMFSVDGSRAVTVAGVLTCRYQKKKSKH